MTSHHGIQHSMVEMLQVVRQSWLIHPAWTAQEHREYLVYETHFNPVVPEATVQAWLDGFWVEAHRLAQEKYTER